MENICEKSSKKKPIDKGGLHDDIDFVQRNTFVSLLVVLYPLFTFVFGSAWADWLRMGVAAAVYPAYVVTRSMVMEMTSPEERHFIDVHVGTAKNFMFWVFLFWFLIWAFLFHAVLFVILHNCYLCVYGFISMVWRTVYGTLWFILSLAMGTMKLSDKIASKMTNVIKNHRTVHCPPATPQNSGPGLEPYKPEAMVPGSDYMDIRAPDCQFAIYKQGVYQGAPIYHGVRIDDYLVFPAHGPHEQMPLCAVYERDGTRYVAILVSDQFIPVCDDILAMPIPPTFPVKKARIAPVAGTAATCTASRRLAGSLGRLESDKFETVTYSGSTSPGHSGAAYMSGSHCVGIHLGSTGKTNIGYASTYVEMRLRVQTQTSLSSETLPLYQGESSDYAYLMKLSNKQLRELDFYGTNDPDIVEVKVAGKFYRIDRDQQRDLEDEVERRDRGHKDFIGAIWDDGGAKASTRGGHYRQTSERKALNKEWKDIQEMIRTTEAAMVAQSESDLPEFSFPENSKVRSPAPMPSQRISGAPQNHLGGPPSPAAPLTPHLIASTSVGTSTDFPPSPVMPGLTEARMPSVEASSATVTSVIQRGPKQPLQRRKRSPTSRRSTTPATLSGPEPQPSTSKQKPAKSPSRKPANPSTSLQAQVLDISERLAVLVKRLDGMDKN